MYQSVKFSTLNKIHTNFEIFVLFRTRSGFENKGNLFNLGNPDQTITEMPRLCHFSNALEDRLRRLIRSDDFNPHLGRVIGQFILDVMS